MSSWISASSSPKRNSASALASSVFPTPVGPAKMNEPPGRLGSFSPARVRRIAWDSALMASSWPMTRLWSSSSMCSRRADSSSVSLNTRDAGGGGEDLGDQLLVDLGDDVHVAGLPLLLALGLGREQLLLGVAQRRGLLEVLRVDRRLLLAAHLGDLLVELAQVRRRRHPADPQPRAGLVDQVDRLVRQEPVVDVPVGQRRRRHERGVGDGDPVVRLVPVAQALEDLDGVGQVRLGHLDRLEAALERRRPSRCACGTRRAWWRRWSAAHRGPASA